MIAKLILFSRPDGSASFKMKLTDKGKRSYQAVEVPFTRKEWNYDPKKNKNELRVRTPRSEDYSKYIRNRDYVKSLEKKYQDQIDQLISLGKSFSFFQVFDAVQNPKKEKPQTLYSVFDAFIEKEKERSAFGNASNIRGTLNKLKSFHPQDLLFNEVDSKFLLRFRRMMEMNKLSNNTISIHLRNIRTVYNYAIKKLGVASLADYPFIDSDIHGNLKSAYKSRALSLKEINALRTFRLKQEMGSELWHACSYFIFGYAGRGINFTDIARLTWDNYFGGRITFVRFKTRSKIQETTSFPVTPELLEIIDWYRKNNRQIGNPYIFPVLNASYVSEKSKRNKIQKARTNLNRSLKIVGDQIGSSIPITTYVWRHSFAHVAKNDLKVDVTAISEMLGHHDLKTTKHYLKNFPDSELDKATAGL